MPVRQLFTVISMAAMLSFSAPAFAEKPETAFDPYDHYPAEVSENGMVVVQEGLAAEVGRQILAKGGNAVDAAVATGFAMAVSHPQAGNIGGGGFMVVWLAEEQRAVAIDFREMAPAGADRDMYLNEAGDADFTLSQYSHLSSGVPGSVMGMIYALENYGTMSRREVMAPAIRLAARGISVSYGLEAALHDNKESLSADPSSVAYFLTDKDGGPIEKGDLLIQKDLARTLREISRKGTKGFYEGWVADAIVEEMARGGGLITHEDLANYKVVEREPVRGTYRGHEIIGMPPPSSGGIHVIQMLNILEGYNNLGELGHNSAAYLHRVIEAMRRAFADRSKYVGDPDYIDVPTKDLIDKAYAYRLRQEIDLEAATPSQNVLPGLEVPYESPQTTHYSVMDKYGNAVGVTTTLNFSFGSGYSVDGAGFLLNNEMDDFSAKPGAPNGYGLIGGDANQIEPGKRPLSSMSPTIVLKDGVPHIITGGSGGSTIITSVLQIILNVIEFDLNPNVASHAIRIHHQWLPGEVLIEPGASADTVDLLEKMGHDMRVLGSEVQMGWIRGSLARTQTIVYKDGYYYGAADPRDIRGMVAGN